MTPPAKRLPESAAQFPSIQYFRDQAEVYLGHEAQGQGKPTPAFSLSEVQVVPGAAENPRFLIHYENQELNRALDGLVRTEDHKLTLWSYPLDQADTRTPLAYLEMQDTCSLTKALVGPERLKSDCQDGVVEPKLVAAQKFPTLQSFDQYCKDSYQSYLADNASLRREGGYDLKRVQLINTTPGNFGYDLFYENPANAFYCRGHVNTRGLQHFFMTSGSLKDYAKLNAEVGEKARYREGAIVKQPEVYEMNDACRMSTALVGEQEFHGNCQEFTAGERFGIKALNTLWAGVEWTFVGAFVYDSAGWMTERVDSLFKTKLYPASFGKWGSPTSWLYQKVIPAGVRARVDLAHLAAKRLGRSALQVLPRLFNGVRLAVSTVGSSAMAWGGTEVAAAGAGSIGLASAIGFAGGFALGIGLEKTQQAIFGTSVSDKLGDWAFQKFGPAKSSTIEWWDKWFGWLP